MSLSLYISIPGQLQSQTIPFNVNQWDRNLPMVTLATSCIYSKLLLQLKKKFSTKWRLNLLCATHFHSPFENGNRRWLLSYSPDIHWLIYWPTFHIHSLSSQHPTQTLDSRCAAMSLFGSIIIDSSRQRLVCSLITIFPLYYNKPILDEPHHTMDALYCSQSFTQSLSAAFQWVLLGDEIPFDYLLHQTPTITIIVIINTNNNNWIMKSNQLLPKLYTSNTVMSTKLTLLGVLHCTLVGHRNLNWTSLCTSNNNNDYHLDIISLLSTPHSECRL